MARQPFAPVATVLCRGGIQAPGQQIEGDIRILTIDRKYLGEEDVSKGVNTVVLIGIAASARGKTY